MLGIIYYVRFIFIRLSVAQIVRRGCLSDWYSGMPLSVAETIKRVIVRGFFFRYLEDYIRRADREAAAGVPPEACAAGMEDNLADKVYMPAGLLV